MVWIRTCWMVISWRKPSPYRWRRKWSRWRTMRTRRTSRKTRTLNLYFLIASRMVIVLCVIGVASIVWIRKRDNLFSVKDFTVLREDMVGETDLKFLSILQIEWYEWSLCLAWIPRNGCFVRVSAWFMPRIVLILFYSFFGSIVDITVVCFCYILLQNCLFEIVFLPLLSQPHPIHTHKRRGVFGWYLSLFLMWRMVFRCCYDYYYIYLERNK